MKYFAKLAFLLVMTGLFGFSAMVLATQSTHLARLLSQDVAAGVESLRDSEDNAVAEAVGIVDVEVSGAISEAVMAPDGLSDRMQTGASSDLNEQASVAQLTQGGALSAVGAIEVAHRRQVTLATNGVVQTIAVKAGDTVQAGDLLIDLDTTFLDWSLEQAEISYETAHINLQELGETVLESDVAMAEANLLLAQENLAQIQEGPTAEELAAAQAAATAGWARYEELKQQPSQAQINQALANLRRAEVNLQAAQREYDKIAWLPEVGATAAADALHRATIDFEAAQAAFEEVNRPATTSELQNALSTAQSAQANLNNLHKRPTPAELADAEARLASAQAAYEKALLGPKESDLRKGELSVRQAMIGLEQARLALENATVVAPIDGVVLGINVELGQQVSVGATLATLVPALDLQLVVNVDQRDIGKVRPGQGVEISVYAMPDVIFLGIVDIIVPGADVDAGFVTFPVLIELIDGPLERLLPGMTASAVFLADVDEATGAASEEAEESDVAPEGETEFDAESDEGSG